MKRLPWVLMVSVLLAGTAAWAASRTWTSADGRFHIQAELVDFRDGKAHLEKSDGTVIEVPLAKFCDKDRAFVKNQFPGAEEEQFRPGAEFREWKSKNGKFSVTAEFVSFSSDGFVTLRKADGTELPVDPARLCKEDQNWLEEKKSELSESEKEPSTARMGDEEPEQIEALDLPMKLLRLDPPRKKSGKKAGASEYYLRLARPQLFHVALGRGGGQDADFRRIAQKEPKYTMPSPFRGVARLGSQEYAFALDAVGPKVAGYNTLYFDADHNGDLTNDKPISTKDVTAGGGISRSQFPRVDVALEAEGKQIDYSFLVNAVCQAAGPEPSASVSLYAAAVREGYIADGKKKVHLVLVDHNGNGRFNDVVTFRVGETSSPTPSGDLLLVNPNPKDMLSADATMGRDRHFVNKTVCIAKRFYRMEIESAGDQLRLTPTTLGTGFGTNSSPAYRAVVFSDDFGVLTIAGTKDQKIPLPEGTWKIASYTLDATAFTGGARTAVTATFGGDPASAAVKKDESVKLPFGGPFRPVVNAHRTGSNRVYLSLAIVGVSGERCTNFYVNGGRPPAPPFVVKDKDGKTIHQGKFEYG